MLFAETNQEAYDNYLQAMRIGEAVGLPIMICQDGFITSHAIENIELVEDREGPGVRGRVQARASLCCKANPCPWALTPPPPIYMEAKRQQAQAMMDAKEVIQKVGEEFGAMTGRTYGLIEKYDDGRRRGGHRHHRLLRRHRQGGHQGAARSRAARSV